MRDLDAEADAQLARHFDRETQRRRFTMTLAGESPADIAEYVDMRETQGQFLKHRMLREAADGKW